MTLLSVKNNVYIIVRYKQEYKKEINNSEVVLSIIDVINCAEESIACCCQGDKFCLHSLQWSSDIATRFCNVLFITDGENAMIGLSWASIGFSSFHYRITVS